jgi:ATP-dependent DNA ligase
LRDLERIPADDFVLFAEAWHPLLDHSTINGTFRRSYLADGAELLEAVVFDYVPLADFEAGACPVRFKTRRDAATELVLSAQGLYSSFEESPLRVSYISQTVDQCQHFVNHSREIYNEEFVIDGFMRKDRDGLWKAGSGSGGESVKLKDHMSIDVKLLRFVEGKGKFAGMVGSLVVLWGEKELTVGGGTMSTAERREQWASVTIGQPQDMHRSWIGRIVEVHGLGESQHGMIREPRLHRLREDKTEGE